MTRPGSQALSNARLAAAEREESRFFEIKNPRPHYAADWRHAWNRRQLFRAPRFLSSTVHGAFSLFAKERMGGANGPAPKGLLTPPPTRATTNCIYIE